MTIPFSLNFALNCTSLVLYFSCDLMNFASIEWLYKETKPIYYEDFPNLFLSNLMLHLFLQEMKQMTTDVIQRES